MAKEAGKVFVKGKKYRMTTFANPVWPPNTTSLCLEVGAYPEGEEGIIGGKGKFTIGDDTRWWVYNPTQFEEA